MAAGTLKPKIELYSLSAHVRGRSVDYRRLLRALRGVPLDKRVRETLDRVYALSQVNYGRRYVHLEVLEGPKGYDPRIFNVQKQSERIEELGESEVLVTKTHCAFDAQRRLAAVEYSHRGAKASHVALLLAKCLRGSSWPELNIELTPVPKSSFLRALKDLDQVKVASVTMARPNFDWEDDGEELAEELADESEARTVRVEMHAPIGGGLARNKGLVQYIRRAAQRVFPTLKSAFVIGTRADGKGRTRVSLSKYTENTRVTVDKDRHGHASTAGLRAAMNEYLGDYRSDAEEA